MTEPAADSLDAFCAPQADPLFWRPTRLGVPSAWYGHIPFGFWLVAAIRPRLLVELGTHAGVSYAAFCEAVVRCRLPTRCFAVDSWLGDQHSGHYGEEVYADFRQFNDQHFRAFSTLLRMDFDAAREQFADGTIDLLHIDGEHTYEAVSHDFETWRRKLSDRAVVVFHDTIVRERDFGVWRLWHELTAQHPGFEFFHSSGLGVLALGPDVPPPLTALLRAVDGAGATIRDRFARLGDGWEAEARSRLLAEEVARVEAQFRAEEAQFRAEGARFRAEEAQFRARLSAAESELSRSKAEAAGLGDSLSTATAELRAAALQETERQAELGALRASRAAATQELREAQATTLMLRGARDAAVRELDGAHGRIAMLTEERALILGSTIWRATAPLRRLGRAVPMRGRRALRRLMGTAVSIRFAWRAERNVVAHADDASNARIARLRIVYISGEAHTPGHAYRVLRYVEAAEAAQADASWLRVEDFSPRIAEVAAADVIILWRVGWSAELQRLTETARAGGARIVFDIDDLMFRPELATPTFIDGIRSQRFAADEVAAHFTRIRDAIAQADACTCTTVELARQLHALQKTVHVLPNGFDAATHQASRLALRRRRMLPEEDPKEDIVRIGYASGTRTHQRDFAEAAVAVARVLAQRPSCRLVLFRAHDSKEPVVNPGEFAVLDPFVEQIEWRDLVPLEGLPDELARFDISLAPLEVGNPFCEAKSELKFFEAALVETCTVASPTGPLRRVVRHGINGLLAGSEDEWHRAIIELVDDPTRRRRLAHAAYLDVLWPFSPARRAELMRGLLAQLGGGAEAARAFELEVRRGTFHGTGAGKRQALAAPETEIIFAADQLGNAEATVIVPLHNYAGYVVEALASVRSQTIPALDLIVIDDASSDASVEVAAGWAREYQDRFNRIVVLRNPANAGLALTRNVGFDAAETPYVLPLDADNRLLPGCVEACLGAIRRSGAAFAYPGIQCFGAADTVFGTAAFEPMRLAGGNYIDAMALVAKWAWAAVGGYAHIEHGWEDYDFWCRCAEHGFWGAPAGEVLAEYRVHEGSMLHTATDLPDNKLRVIEQLERRHGWLSIPRPIRQISPSK